jgi:hypothetical protein
MLDGWDAGSVNVRLGGDFDRKGFDQYDRAIERAERKKKVEAELGAEVDERAFKAYDRAMDRAEDRAKLRGGVKAALGGDFDARGFRAFESALRSAERHAHVEAHFKANPSRLYADLVKIERRISDTRREIEKPADAHVDIGVAEAKLKLLERQARETRRAIAESQLGMGGGGGGLGALATLGGMAAGGAAAIPILGTLAGTVTGLVGAVGALAGSLFSAVGGLGALGTAAGATAIPGLALLGGVVERLTKITDAYKQQEQSADQASLGGAAAAQQHAASAEGLRSAKLGVKSATEQVTRAERQEQTARAEARKKIDDASASERKASRDAIAAQQAVTRARRDAAKAARDADEQVVQSHIDVKNAELGIASAQDKLRQLRIQGKQGTLDYAQAQNDLEQANVDSTRAHDDHSDALAKQKRFATEGARAYQPYVDALRRASEAQLRLTKAQDNLQRLQRRGIAGSAQVVAATENVRHAHEQLAQAVHQVSVAQDNIAKQDSVGKAAAKSQLALSKLTASERGFLRVLHQVAGAWERFSRPATDAVFKGMGEGLTAVIPVLGKLKGSFTGLGREVGRQFAGFGHMLATPAWTKALNTFTQGATKMVRALGPGFRDFADILKNVALAAMPGLLRLTRQFVGWLDKVDQWSKTASFRKTITEMVGQFGSWLKLMGAVARLLTTILLGGAKDGRSLVDSLTKIVNRWNAWLNTDRGQRQMLQFFRDSATVTRGLLGALAPLIHVFAQLAVGSLKFVSGLPGPLRQVAQTATGFALLAMWKPGLYKVPLKGIQLILGAFKLLARTDAGWKVVQAITGPKGLGGLQKAASGVWKHFKGWLVGTSAKTGLEAGAAEGEGQVAGGIGSKFLARFKKAFATFKRWLLGASATAGAEAGAAEGEAAAGAGGMLSKGVKGKWALAGKALGGVMAASIIAQLTGIEDADPLLFLHPPSAGDPRPGHGDVLPKSEQGGQGRGRQSARGPGGRFALPQPDPSSAVGRGDYPRFRGSAARAFRWLIDHGFVRDVEGVHDPGKLLRVARRHGWRGRQFGGTVVPGETTLVGEAGPELARFPAGTQITPAGPTARAIARATGDSSGLAGTLEQDRKRAQSPLRKIAGDLAALPKAALLHGKKTAKDLVDQLELAGKEGRKRTDKLHKDASGDFEDLRKDSTKSVKRLSDDSLDHFEDLRKGGTKKATRLGNDFGDQLKALRSGADRVLRGMASTAGDRFSDMSAAAKKHGSRLRSFMADSLSSADKVVATGLGYVGRATDEALKSFGARGLHFSIDKPPGKAVGGIANPAGGSADDHLLLDPSGRPVAAMAGTEGIVNTPQMGVIDQALAFAKHAGGLAWGSLRELWGSGMTHYAKGGKLSHWDRLVGAANKVDRASFPYRLGGGHEQPAHFEPFDCSGAVSYVVQQAGYRVPTSVSGGMGSVGLPKGKGRVTIYYNAGHTWMDIGGRAFGTSGFARPNGGAGWFTQQPGAGYRGTFSTVHLPDLGKEGVEVGGAGGAAPADIPTPHVRGRGPWAALARRALKRAAGAGGRHVGRVFERMNPGGGQSLSDIPSMKGPWVGVLNKIAKRLHWSADDWKWIVGHESSGVPSQMNASGHFGFGQLDRNAWSQYGGGPGSSPAQQIVGMGRYIAGRYGNPTKAKAFWRQHNWYAGGGMLGDAVRSAGRVVGASVYGLGEAGTGTMGKYGYMPGHMAFAELGMGHALGGLRPHQKVRISYRGRSVVAEKRDIGRGGPPVGGHHRAIDLWRDTARALHFGSGVGLVTIGGSRHGRHAAAQGGLLGRAVESFKRGGRPKKKKRRGGRNPINFHGVARWGPFGVEYHESPRDPYRPALLEQLETQATALEDEGLPLAALTPTLDDDIMGERFLVSIWQRILDIRKAPRYRFPPADIGEAASNLKSHRDALEQLLAPPDTSADTQAQLDQALGRENVEKETNRLLRGAFDVFQGPGDIGAGALTALRAAANPWSTEGPGPGLGLKLDDKGRLVHVATPTGPQIIVQTLHPGDSRTLDAIARAANAGNSQAGYVTAPRAGVGV